MKMGRYPLCLAFSLAVGLAAAGSPCGAWAQEIAAPPPQFEDPAGMDENAPPIELGVSYTADINADVAGGARQGAAYLGKLAVIADANPGFNNTRIHASALSIHGTGLSGAFVQNLATISGLEAEPATRLNQLWLETDLPGRARLRIGKFAAAPTFMSSDTANFFVNATFGWPTSFAQNLPQGGPSWPLAAPGVMVRSAAGKTRASLAIFAGLPSGNDSDDPQRSDGYGFNTFRLRGAPLVIGEVDRTAGAVTLKAGGWYQFGPADILPKLVHPPRGNWSAYGIVDWTISTDATSSRSLSAFTRVTVAPDNRNQVGAYVDMGLVLQAPFAGRPEDAVGLGFAYINASDRGAEALGIRNERVIEASYSAQVTGALALQPNVQWVHQSTGPTAAPSQDWSDALVFGMRMALQL